MKRIGNRFKVILADVPLTLLNYPMPTYLPTISYPMLGHNTCGYRFFWRENLPQKLEQKLIFVFLNVSFSSLVPAMIFTRGFAAIYPITWHIVGCIQRKWADSIWFDFSHFNDAVWYRKK